MYRQLLFVTLCLHTTSTAPQDDRKSEITFFKDNSEINVDNNEEITTVNPSLISIIDDADKKDSLNHSDVSETEALSDVIPEVNVTKTDKRAAYVEDFPSEENNNNNLLVINGNIETKVEENKDSVNIDSAQSETKFERKARDFEDQTTSSYETENLNSTEKSEEAIEDTKTSPKFAPKVNYSKKFGGSSYNKNYIENPSKRKFRSRCRCEKIWNCPKLQISVPRCPEEQFMCCF